MAQSDKFLLLVFSWQGIPALEGGGELKLWAAFLTLQKSEENTKRLMSAYLWNPPAPSLHRGAGYLARQRLARVIHHHHRSTTSQARGKARNAPIRRMGQPT